MNALEIIGKLYTLLSECNSDELRDAASIAGDTDLGNALTQLAKAKLSIEGKQHEKRQPTAFAFSSSKKPSSARNGLDSRIEKIVLDPHIISSNTDVAKFLSSLGLGISFRGKDGRQAMLKKLRDAIYSASDSDRKQLLSRIYAVLPKTETTGWFEAIRGDGE